MFIGSRASFVISLYVLMFVTPFFYVLSSHELDMFVPNSSIGTVVGVTRILLEFYLFVWLSTITHAGVRTLYYGAVIVTLLFVLWFWSIAFIISFWPILLKDFCITNLPFLELATQTETIGKELSFIIFWWIYFFIGIFNLLCLINKN